MNKEYHENTAKQRFSLVVPQEFNLTERDKKMLQASGAPVDLQMKYARRVNEEQASELVGQKSRANRDLAGIAFFVFGDPCTKYPSDFELRRDNPDLEIKDGVQKETGKYLKPPGRGNLLSFPQDLTTEEINDISIPVIICEGPKKFLSLEWLATYKLAKGEKRRFIPIAVSGVNNWRGKVGKATDSSGHQREVKGLLAGFHKIPLKHRPVIILFDNDTHKNPKVRAARHNFAAVLQSETGANCYLLDLPKSDEKIGIDDAIGNWQAEFGLDKAMLKGLEFLDKKYRFSSELQSVLLDGKITLGVSGADRGKCKVTVRDNANNEVITIDTFNLSEADKRNRFLKQIDSAFPLSADEKTEIQRELLGLAEISDSLFESTVPERKSDEVIETSFQVLKDGRIIEQIRGGLALYDPADGSHSIVDTVEDTDGTKYLPEADDLLTKEGGIYLANDLMDYGDEAQLDADIEAYLQVYADISVLHRKMTAKYIRFTYLFDKTYELPYITTTGDGGNGKTRVGELVCLASRRGLTLVNPSAPSLFRITDKYQPTLFLDELNLSDTGEDTLAILQVLNSGIKRNTGYVPRQEKGADGNFQTRLYKTFSPKIIGSLKKTNSAPFNSRCIQIEMEATKRNDIPFRTTSQMLRDAQELRNKLTLYRLRQFSEDFERKLDEAEKEMKRANLKPRTIQVNTPLLALTEDKALKADFLNLLKDTDTARASEKLETLDGEIVQAIHSIVFPTDEDGKESIIYFEHGKLCQDLRVESILDVVNADRKEKDKIDARRMGQLLKGLKIQTSKILTRGANRDKKAIIFECLILQKLFEKFSLPLLPGNTCHQCHQNANTSNINNLSGDKSNIDEKDLSPDNPNGSNNYEVVTSGDKHFTNYSMDEGFGTDREVFEI